MNLSTLPRIGEQVRLVRRDGRVFGGRLHAHNAESIVLDVSIAPRKVRDGREPHLIRVARSAVVSIEAHNPMRGFCD